MTNKIITSFCHPSYAYNIPVLRKIVYAKYILKFCFIIITREILQKLQKNKNKL